MLCARLWPGATAPSESSSNCRPMAAAACSPAWTSATRRRCWTSWKRRMILPDTNILIYAHRPESPNHRRYRQWLEGVANGDEAYGIFDVVLSSFIRIVTNSRIYREPTPLEVAVSFVEKIREASHAVNL